MLANRAIFGRFFALMNVPALTAYPLNFLVTFKNFIFLHLLEKLL